MNSFFVRNCYGACISKLTAVAAESRLSGTERRSGGARARVPTQRLANDDRADHPRVEMSGYEAAVVELTGARELPYQASRGRRCDVCDIRCLVGRIAV